MQKEIWPNVTWRSPASDLIWRVWASRMSRQDIFRYRKTPSTWQTKWKAVWTKITSFILTFTWSWHSYAARKPWVVFEKQQMVSRQPCQFGGGKALSLSLDGCASKNILTWMSSRWENHSLEKQLCEKVPKVLSYRTIRILERDTEHLWVNETPSVTWAPITVPSRGVLSSIPITGLPHVEKQ